jgi:hypothetical protein
MVLVSGIRGEKSLTELGLLCAAALPWRQLLLFPRTGVWGRAPNWSPKSFGALLKCLAIDHDQVEFLGPDAAGLEPPQIDHQLSANGHDGFFLQRPVRTPELLLVFLHRFVLRLEKDDAPDHLGDDAPYGWYAYLGN